jgi:YD repeat-containing protein
MGDRFGDAYYYGGIHNYGNWSNGQLFRHAITLSGNLLKSTHVENSITKETVTLGTVEAHKTYVIEYETTATQSTVFVYEKGKTKADAWTHTVNVNDSTWGNTRFQLYSNPREGKDGAEIYIDNVALRPLDSDSSLSSQKDEYVSTKYHYDVNGRLKYSIDAEGYISENVYNSNGQIIKTLRHDSKFDTTTQKLSKPVSWQSSSAQVAVMNNTVALLEGSTDGWSYSARSNEFIKGEGFIEFSMPSLNKNVMVGLNHTDTTNSYSDLDYAFYHYSDNSIRIYEEGSHKLRVNISQKEGNRYRIEIKNGVAKYFVKEEGTLDFVLVYTSNRAVDPDKNYFVDASLYSAEAIAQDVIISDTVLNESSASSTKYIYDALGRQQYTINSEGYLSENVFDKSGNIIEKIQYDVKLNEGQDAVDIIRQATASLSEEQIRSTKYFYDGASRQRFVVNAEGYITETIYNLRGQVIETKEYEDLKFDDLIQTIDNNAMVGHETAESIEAIIKGLTDNKKESKSTYAVYDTVGRVRFNINALGEVTENIFDDSGRVVQTVAYAENISNIASISKDEMTIASQVALMDSTKSRRSYFVYDALGQVRFSINSKGYVTENIYDGNGRVVETIQYQNEYSGTLSTATEAGLVEYYSTNYTENDRNTKTDYDALGNVVVAYDADEKFESYSYDAFGNVTSFTNKKGDTWNYIYDKVGNLVEERTPRENMYYSDINGNPVEVSNASIVNTMEYDYLGNIIRRTEGILDNGIEAITDQARTTEYRYDKLGNQVQIIYPSIGSISYVVNTYYDAFGNAVANQDVAGNYSYRVYDKLNREKFAVDAEGYVTAYTYNSFGEQSRITRYENEIYGFELQGNNPFKESDLQAFVSSQTKSRTLIKEYDLIGRLISTIQPKVSVYDVDSSSSYAASPKIEFEYNAFGDVVEERSLISSYGGNEKWAVTNHYYNELGQRIGTLDAQGYYTKTEYNAYGEVHRTIEFAKKTEDRSTFNPLVGPGTNNRSDKNAQGESTFDETLGADRIRSFKYDRLGRLTHEFTESHYYQVGVNSSVAIGVGQSKTRELIVTTEYDALGNVVLINQQNVITKKGYNKLGHSSFVEHHARKAMVDTDVSSFSVIDGAIDFETSGEVRSPYVAYKTDAFGNILEERNYALGKGGDGTLITSQQDVVNTFVFDVHGNKVKHLIFYTPPPK